MSFSASFRVAAVAALGWAATIVATAAMPSPFLIEGPGLALNVLGDIGGTPMIEIKGAKTYPDTSSLSLTAVSVYGAPGQEISGLATTYGWLSSNYAVVPREVYYPVQTTAKEAKEEGLAQMQSSQDDARVAALEQINYPVSMQLTVAGFTNDSPAKNKLKAGDILKTLIVGGKDISVISFPQLIEQLNKTPAGSTIGLVFSTEGKENKIYLQTLPNPQGAGSRLGIMLDRKISYPFTVKMTAGQIGGPSAGLMFSLGIIDLLTPGKLAGDVKVAGTGTINMLREVGPIGGIRQKMLSAAWEGNTVFLAPKANCGEVVGHVPSTLRVYPVENIDQALSVLDAVKNKKTVKFPSCEQVVEKTHSA